jgi:hypothetical protein
MALAIVVVPLSAVLAQPAALVGQAAGQAVRQRSLPTAPNLAPSVGRQPLPKRRHHGLAVLHPGQYVQLAGTDVYAVVTDSHQGVALWGQIVPPGSRRGEGYFFVAQESRVAVGKWATGGGGGVYIFEEPQPPGAPPSTRAHHAAGGFTMSPGQEMRVDGTSLVLSAGHDARGNPSLVSLLMPGHAPLPGSYEVAISEAEVGASRWERGKPVPVFSRSEPASLRTSATTSTTTTTATPPTPPRHGHDGIGSSATLDELKVKLVSVQDNASPLSPQESAPGGETLDTVTHRVTNLGPQPFQANANGATATVGSDGRTYSPDIGYAAAGCTGFGSGATAWSIDLPPGASETGCVSFVVPDGVAIKLVEFSPGANWAPGGYISWSL